MPTRSPVKAQRNLSLECVKLLASVFVVFLHVPFPGTFGALVQCLSRFAVPLFFAISGWYSYQVPSARLAKRLKHILLLELLGSLLYIALGTGINCFWGGDLRQLLTDAIPRKDTLAAWLLLSLNPYKGHLWYLSAAALCYLVLGLYVRGFGFAYRPLYLAGILLAAGHFTMGILSGAAGAQVSYLLYRNGLFFGLPMFLMGLFLRQYRDRILENFSLTRRKLLLMLGAGALTAVLEWQALGLYDLYFGTVVTVAALLLLTSRYPDVPRWLQAAAARFGRLSTWVYLLHLAVYDLLVHLWYPLNRPQGPDPWLLPLLTLALTLLPAVFREALSACIHKEKLL